MIFAQNKKIFLVLIFWVAILAIAFIFWPQKKVGVSNDVKDNKNINQDKKEEKCGIESCHGLEISCGKNVPEVCTEEYQLGDACRKFAHCQIQNEKCLLQDSENFDQCKTCTEECQKNFSKNISEMFECERDCHKKINETSTPVLD